MQRPLQLKHVGRFGLKPSVDLRRARQDAHQFAQADARRGGPHPQPPADAYGEACRRVVSQFEN